MDFTARIRGEQVSSDDTSTVTGSDGKSYPATRAPAARAAEPEEEYRG